MLLSLEESDFFLLRYAHHCSTKCSLVVALDMDGNELWVSDALSGVASGTPVISDNGESVFLTHNSEVFSVGHFSILEADAGTLSYNMSDPFNAFAPPGIYHNPAQGWYDGGEGNFNDMIMWTVSPPPFATSIGEGLLFGFQYPPDPLDPPAAITLGDVRNFQGITPPVMTNEGKSAYWSVSRSNWFTWVGIEGLKRTYFSRSHTANIGFTRNAQFKGQPCFAPPALSSSTTEPVVFGGTAAAEFVRTTFDFSQKRTKTLSSIVYSQAVVDPADRVVYYAESAGFVHRGNFVNLNDNWVYELEGGTQGEIALSENGSILYVADTGGKITALQVAEIPATAEPSAPPSGAPSAEPTLAPAFPTPSPSGAPTTPLPTDIASAPPTGVSAGASKQIWAISLVAAAASLFLN